MKVITIEDSSEHKQIHKDQVGTVAPENLAWLNLTPEVLNLRFNWRWFYKDTPRGTEKYRCITLE
jgi:hypothetical protein